MRSPLLVVLAALALPASSTAQQKQGLNVKYFGVKACITGGCHSKESEEYANLEKLARGDHVFTSRLVEYSIWSKHDKHKDAARVLKNERSKQIAAIMKLPPDLTNEPRCANCHGVYIDPTQEEQLIHSDTFQGEDRLASGVSCVACHGPISKWVNEHVAPIPEKKWSYRTRAEKKHDFGLRDLWNPVERAELCFSCHIGNIQENKFVTHEMYAAGHPPLPGIEIATFSEAMPAHWESLSQKAARARQLGEKAKNGPTFLKNAYGVDASAMDMEQTRFVAVTSLVAFRDAIRMMESFAAESLAKPSERPWPELAFYDCYACHHDLKSKSWRLERGYSGKPGRPTVRPWPTGLALVADRLIAGQPSPLDKALPSWNALFHDVPFGDTAEVKSGAGRIVKLLEQQIRVAQEKTFDRAGAERAQRLILQSAKSHAHDFDTARQFAWALRTIAIELQNEGGYGLVKSGEPRLKGPVAGPFATLEKSLQLKLPEGQVEIVPTMLDQVLGRISAYEPGDFHKAINEIDRVLGGKQTPP
jgi:hypothetical protein